MTLTLKPHVESDEWDERTVHSQKHGPDSTLTSLGKPDQLTALLHTHWCSAGDQNQDEHTEMGRVCWSSRSTKTYNSLKHRQKSTRTQSGLVFSWCQEQMWGQLVSRHHPAAPYSLSTCSPACSSPLEAGIRHVPQCNPTSAVNHLLRSPQPSYMPRRHSATCSFLTKAPLSPVCNL